MKGLLIKYAITDLLTGCHITYKYKSFIDGYIVVDLIRIWLPRTCFLKRK
jgi:hypothetical protein